MMFGQINKNTMMSWLNKINIFKLYIFNFVLVAHDAPQMKAIMDMMSQVTSQD